MPEITTFSFIYKNHRGEIARRTVLPARIFFGSTEWHPEPQWLMEAFDVVKGEMRTFALKDINASALPERPLFANSVFNIGGKSYKFIEVDADGLTAHQRRLGDAYQILGALAGITMTLDEPEVQRALSWLNMEEIDGEILPWPREPLVPDLTLEELTINYDATKPIISHGEPYDPKKPLEVEDAEALMGMSFKEDAEALAREDMKRRRAPDRPDMKTGKTPDGTITGLNPTMAIMDDFYRPSPTTGYVRVGPKGKESPVILKFGDDVFSAAQKPAEDAADLPHKKVQDAIKADRERGPVQIAKVKTFTVGPETMAKAFKLDWIDDGSGLQALLDTVEKALKGNTNG